MSSSRRREVKAVAKEEEHVSVRSNINCYGAVGGFLDCLFVKFLNRVPI